MILHSKLGGNYYKGAKFALKVHLSWQRYIGIAKPGDIIPEEEALDKINYTLSSYSNMDSEITVTP